MKSFQIGLALSEVHSRRIEIVVAPTLFKFQLQSVGNKIQI